MLKNTTKPKHIDYKSVQAKLLLLGAKPYPNDMIWSIRSLLDAKIGKDNFTTYTDYMLMIRFKHASIDYNNKAYYAENLDALYTDIIQDVKKYSRT